MDTLILSIATAAAMEIESYGVFAPLSTAGVGFLVWQLARYKAQLDAALAALDKRLTALERDMNRVTK